MLDVERPNLVEELAETFDQSMQLTLEVFNQSFSLDFVSSITSIKEEGENIENGDGGLSEEEKVEMNLYLWPQMLLLISLQEENFAKSLPQKVAEQNVI